MTHIKSIEIRNNPNGLRVFTFLSWDDANAHVREIARTLCTTRFRDPNEFRVTVEWADTTKMSTVIDIDEGHAIDPAALSTELYDAVFASCGYDFGPTPTVGFA